MFGAIDADIGRCSTNRCQFKQFRFEPEATCDKYLIVAAATTVHLATGIAETFDQSRLDCLVPVLEALIEHEIPAAKIIAELIEFTQKIG